MMLVYILGVMLVLSLALAVHATTKAEQFAGIVVSQRELITELKRAIEIGTYPPGTKL